MRHFDLNIKYNVFSLIGHSKFSLIQFYFVVSFIFFLAIGMNNFIEMERDQEWTYAIFYKTRRIHARFYQILLEEYQYFDLFQYFYSFPANKLIILFHTRKKSPFSIYCRYRQLFFNKRKFV